MGTCRNPGLTCSCPLFCCCRFEVSALTLRSLRREVLCLLSASSKSMADPDVLLAQALDPPEIGRVKEAMDYLQTVSGLGQ